MSEAAAMKMFVPAAASIRHVDVKDIKQEAGVALCRAADTYDPSRGIPFRASIAKDLKLKRDVRFIFQTTWTEIDDYGDVVPGTEAEVGFDGDA